MKTVNDINFKDKKALIRVDFNVPLNDKFQVTDTTRIQAAKPTILKVLEDGGSAILMSHLGRPKGVEEKFSLKHIVKEVTNILGVHVKFEENCVGKLAEKAAAELQNGEILLLENLRFHPEEKAGDKDFAEELSKLGDIYVNDGITLTIDPGIFVEFQGHYKLEVDGTLLAIGTASDMITFTAVDHNTGWNSIVFDFQFASPHRSGAGNNYKNKSQGRGGKSRHHTPNWNTTGRV